MKSGLKRSAQSPPAPSPCAAPERLSFADCRNSRSTLNPASSGAFVSFAISVPRRYGPMPACRFWLTFKVILISSERGGETCSATLFSGIYERVAEEKSAEAELATDLIWMPAATRASRKTVSANFLGDGTAIDAGCVAIPSGRVPESVTTTEPSGFAEKICGSRDGLESAGEVIMWLTIRM